MTIRQWLAAAAVAAGSASLSTPVFAADPTPAAAKPSYGFSTLKPMDPAAAKAKLETWLKSTGKFDAAKLEALWATPNRTATDRTLDVILAGLPAAAPVLDQARNPAAPAPTETPAVLKDASLDPFVKANLAAAYAKALAGKRVYEEALDAVKGIAPEQLVDPAGYYFYKAVAEHALIQRESAVASIVRLLDDVADAPDRYRIVATLMYFDIQNWAKDEKDLTNIGRLMDNSGRRLDLARGGPKTQEIQKKIVFRLDEKIKELENKAKKQQQQQQQPGDGQPGGQPGDDGCPSSPMPGNGQGNPTGPMQDSNIATNGGKGVIDEKKLRSYEQEWGKLPEVERKKIVQQITRDLPPKYKPMIEDYFRSLNRMHGYKDNK